MNVPYATFNFFGKIDMAKLEIKSGLKQLRNRYRLVIMNDDTYEEVVTFKLSRLSVYVVFSSVFVILTCLTIALIVFTPLKQYLPGYGSMGARRELQLLKIKTDSLELSMNNKDQYLANIKKVLIGDVKQPMDTTMQKDLKPEKGKGKHKRRRR